MVEPPQKWFCIYCKKDFIMPGGTNFAICDCQLENSERKDIMNIPNLIEEDIKRRDRKYEESHPAGWFHPSSFGRCYRLQYYQMLGTKKDNEDARLVPFVGTLIHKYIQGLLPEDTVEVGGFNTKKNIHWSADYYNPIEGYIEDFKCPKFYGYKMVTKKDYDFVNGKKTNILQLTTYGLELEVEDCRLTFVSRDDMSMVTFPFKVKDFKDEVNEELDILNGYKSKGKLPNPIPRAFGGKDCAYCGWAKRCQREQVDSIVRRG